MTQGSLQLQRYLSARRRGATMMTACAESAIPVSEARLIENDIARDPSMLDPPTKSPGDAAPDTSKLGSDPSSREPEGHGALPRPPRQASNRADSAEENDDMPRGKRKAPDGVINGELPKPDFDRAIKLYREDIKPAQSKVGEFAQEQSTAFKEIKKVCHIQPQAAKAAFKLEEMEPAKRDDWLRSFNGLLRGFGIFMPRDLADIAEGKGTAAENVVPIGDAPKPKLATIPQSDGVDADLAGDEPEGDTDDLPHAAE